jgi:ABC-type lipoprotein export system ATPase subunit
MMIQVEDLRKTFVSGRGRIEAITGVSFGLEEGANLVILGKSGSGKTTLLNCVGGLERPDRGTITCCGVEITSLSQRALSLFQRRNMGFVFQFGNLISYLTVAENIGFPLELTGISGKAKGRRIEEVLEGVGLSGTGDALPRELSGGEMQRIAFARAISHEPRILLADEPTANLDSKTAKELVALIFSITKEKGCTAVIATHDQEVTALGDHRLYLKDGCTERLD